LTDINIWKGIQTSFKIKRKHHSFQSEKNMLGLKQLLHSKSAIQSAIIPGNENGIDKNFKKKDLM
jgi:hypothetical protein